MNTRVNNQERESLQILRDGENTFEALEGIRSNLSKLFLEAGSTKKLHDRYVQQRQGRAWNFAKKIDETIKRYPSRKELVLIYQTVLRNIQIARWTKPEDINEDSIRDIAQTIAQYPIDKEKPNITVIMTLLERMGMTRSWVERFLSGSLDREISQKMQ